MGGKGTQTFPSNWNDDILIVAILEYNLSIVSPRPTKIYSACNTTRSSRSKYDFAIFSQLQASHYKGGAYSRFIEHIKSSCTRTRSSLCCNRPFGFQNCQRTALEPTVPCNPEDKVDSPFNITPSEELTPNMRVERILPSQKTASIKSHVRSSGRKGYCLAGISG